MAVRIGWTIQFEGKAFTESDLTLADAIRALDVCGGTWTELHPLTSPGHLVALLATFLAATGENFDQALVRVSQLKLVDGLDLVSAGEPSEG